MGKKVLVLDGKQKAKPDYALAVAELRKQCRMSQFALAIEVGVQPTTVARWEGGSRQPDNWNYQSLYTLASVKRKDALARFFQGKLPPRKTMEEIVDEALAAEREGASAAGEDGKPSAPAGKDRDAELLRQYNDAATGLNLLYDAAADGHEAAKKSLIDLADKLTTRGGNWRKMKYLRKGGK